MLLNWRNLYCIRAENAFNHSTLNLLILTKIYVVAYQFCLIFDEKSNFEIINAIFSSYQKLKQESNTFNFLFFTHQLMIQKLSLGVELNRFLLNVRNSKRSAGKWVCAWSPDSLWSLTRLTRLVWLSSPAKLSKLTKLSSNKSKRIFEWIYPLFFLKSMPTTSFKTIQQPISPLFQHLLIRNNNNKVILKTAITTSLAVKNKRLGSARFFDKSNFCALFP